MTTHHAIDYAFDALTANYDQVPRCQETTQRFSRCRHKARWLLSLHGCESAIMCTQHLRAWENRARLTMQPRCEHCDKTFPSVAHGYTARPL